VARVLDLRVNWRDSWGQKQFAQHFRCTFPMNTSVRFSYDDLLQLPDDGKRHEIIGGELYTTPSPSPEHQDIVGEFFFELKLLLRSNPLGRAFVAPVAVIFHIDDVVIPDVMFISNERQQLINKRSIYRIGFAWVFGAG
jgi:Uma2 family endonuclease